MDPSKPEGSDETMSMGSNEMHLFGKASVPSPLALETSASSNSDGVSRDPPSPPIANSFEKFEASVGDAPDLVHGRSTEETHPSAEKKGGYVSPPSYLHNLVNGEPFSNGLPPPPILLDTRIGSENSAFSSVSGGGMLRPMPSTLSFSDRSASPSSLHDEEQQQQPTVTPSPNSSRENVEREIHMVSTEVKPEAYQEDSPAEPPAEPVVKTSPQRRLQLFERASRLAIRNRKKKAMSKSTPKLEVEEVVGQQQPSFVSESEEVGDQQPSYMSSFLSGSEVSETQEVVDQQPTLVSSFVSEQGSPSSTGNDKGVAEVEPLPALLQPASPPPPSSPVAEAAPVSPHEAQTVMVTVTSRNPPLPPSQPEADEEKHNMPQASHARPPAAPFQNVEAAPPAVKAKYARASPLARMRSDRAQEAAAMSPEAIAEAEAAAAKAAKLFEKQQKTEEEIVAETHRRWRRSLQKAKRKQRKRRDGGDRGTLPQVAKVACDTDLKLLSLIKYEFQNLLTSGCGRMEDIMSLDSFDDDDYSMVSEETYSSYEDETEADEDEDRRERNRWQQERRNRESRSSHVVREVELDQRKRSVDNPFDGLTDSVFSSEALPPPEQRPESRNSAVKNADVDINDKNFITAFIHEASHEGMTFIWHKEAKSSLSLTQPLTVQLCLKLGHSGSDGRLVGPRLTWSDCSIDLFDIQSVEKSSAVQMQNYPFAIPGNSFFVRKNDGKDYAFEASNDEEARRFIHGLRWLVARLAFNLIIGNRDVSCELISLFEENGQLTETEETKAMNDVTNHLVKKIAFHSMEL